jgi:argonaute-like protein implicated in RNA metabolism and viral defense
MEPNLIISIVGFSTIFIERLFFYLSKTKKSHFKSTCCNDIISVEIDKELQNSKK